MKIIDKASSRLVSGGVDLTITRLISTEGISDICVKALLDGLAAYNNHQGSEADIFGQILASCSSTELDLFHKRIDEAGIQTISFS